MNTQINIVENGTTTLATAGKYCDRNIDVNVNIPSDAALVNSIIDKTISGEYVNDAVTEVGSYALAYSGVESVAFPNATKINQGAFQNCTSLKRAEFTNLGSSTGIYANVFKNCSGLETVIIRGTVVGRLAGANAFDGSSIASKTGFIYVPDNLVDSYKTATNWSTHASQIKSLSELEE